MRNNMRLSLMGALIALLAGCATNPVTGERQLVMMSASDEAKAGAAAHPKIIAAFGGVYDDPRLGAYVAHVADRLAKSSGLPVSYRLTVLDSPVINAFALPGGYVYVTRGLLALAGDEAELAGVLGHEIGHVDARHSAERETAAMGASVLGAVLGAVVGTQAVSQIVGMGGQGLLASYSRDQEYEADALGVKALSRAGYDPYAGASFLARMGAADDLISQGDKGKQDWLSSHPATPDRVAAAKAHAVETGARAGAGERDVDAYLDAIDGMIYGDSPAQGMVRGREFVHPGFRFAFTAPRGFALVNTAQAVGIEGPDKTIAKFDSVEKPASLDIRSYLVSGWGAQVALQSVTTFRIGDMQAASGSTRIGSYNATLFAIEFAPTHVVRFLIGILPQAQGRYENALDQMVMSFRRLSEREAAEMKPLRIHVLTVRPGETVETFVAKMSGVDDREKRFRVLNGLSARETLAPGMRVKIVAP